jgi:hypothetical protein
VRIVLLLSTFLACNATAPPPAAPAPLPSVADAGPPADGSPSPVDASPPPSSDVVIRLERTPCLGTCPVYTLAIHGDGSWLLAGWYPHKGCATGKIAPAEVQTLLAQARSIGYASMPSSFTKPITDMPSTDSQVTLGGKTKKIHHYGYSNDPVEKRLTGFEEAIDRAVDTPSLLASPLHACEGRSPYPGVP